MKKIKTEIKNEKSIRQSKTKAAMPSSAKSLRKARKLKRQKIITQERSDDIPNCPSLESVEYYDYSEPESATADVGEWMSVDGETKTSKKSEQKTPERIHDISNCPNLNESAKYYSFSDSESGTADVSRTADASGCSTSVTTNGGKKNKEKTKKAKKKKAKRDSERQREKDFVYNATVSLGNQAVYVFGKMIKYGLKYPTPAGIALSIFCLYLIIMYLDFSAAAFAEWCIQWFWPTTRLALRFCERFHRKMASMISEFDDVGQSSFCDMAALWCERYGMLCEYRCSFTDMAWERTRH